MSDETPKPPTVVSLSDKRKARLRSENDEFPFDLAERLKRRADTAEATANASKPMLDHVRRVHNALNNACLLRDPTMKAAELKYAREELDKAIAILERAKHPLVSAEQALTWHQRCGCRLVGDGISGSRSIPDSDLRNTS